MSNISREEIFRIVEVATLDSDEMEEGENPDILARIVKQIRLERGLSQNDIANIIGISQNGYSKMERGYSLMKLHYVSKIAEHLGFNKEDLHDAIRDKSIQKMGKIKKVSIREFDKIKDSILYVESTQEDVSIIRQLEEKNNYLERTVKAQEETIQLLKEKIAMLEGK